MRPRDFFGSSKNFVDGVALRATTNPAAGRIACRRLAPSIPRPASRLCLGRREISVATLRVSSCRRTRKAAFAAHETSRKARHGVAPCRRPSPHTKLHEKHDTDVATCKWPENARSRASRTESTKRTILPQAAFAAKARLRVRRGWKFREVSCAAPSTKNLEVPFFFFFRLPRPAIYDKVIACLP
jgi:hypothetical protein